MRGKAFWGIHVVIRQGITPAYAGKSFRSDRPKATVQDHPRLCGEKSCGGQCGEFPIGSPPPMRGKGYTTAAESEENRITPAYAGKRWEGLKMAQDFEDHPRLCGEKQLPERHGQGWLRITPAYAGKSLYNTSNAICIQDHPRLCGEKTTRRPVAEPVAGSPPPMRGKGHGAAARPPTPRDHPRLCGEKA